MKFQSVTTVILLSVFQFFFSINGQTQCANPLELDWVKSATNSSCTDTIYAFTYKNEKYVYLTRKGGCLDADWSNELYNCNTNTSCYVLGFTAPEEQCEGELLSDIFTFFTDEYAIFPFESNCKASAQFEAEKGDIYIDNPCYGVILTAPDGICYRLTVKIDGSLKTFPVRCPQ